MLNSMGGADFEESLRTHAAWGLRTLDLKDSLFGKRVTDLEDADLARIRRLIDEHGMDVSNLSTQLFEGAVEAGCDAWQNEYLSKVPRTIEIARVLQPRCIRLLACRTERRSEVTDATAYLVETHPWAIAMYREAVEQVRTAGFNVLIENEAHKCIWSRPAEVLAFFDQLGSGAGFMWDIQNMWQMGTFPSIEVYRQLRPIIRQVHLKGGMSEMPGGPLKWRSALEDASWPVREIVAAVLADGVSPILCLNPSHGQPKDGYDYSSVTQWDIEFLRREFPEIR
jgi:sugar phosphate isomerase/epimerase